VLTASKNVSQYWAPSNFRHQSKKAPWVPFLHFAILKNVPASGQSHWRSSGHYQTVGNAKTGFARPGHRRFASMLKNSRTAVFHSFSCRRRTSWTILTLAVIQDGRG